MQENLENDEAAAKEIWDPLLQYLFSQQWFHRRKQMDHIFIFADGQSARVWDSYDLVRSEAIFMMVESPGRLCLSDSHRIPRFLCQQFLRKFQSFLLHVLEHLGRLCRYRLVNQHNYGQSQFLMVRLNISMAMASIAMLNYKRAKGKRGSGLCTLLFLTLFSRPCHGGIPFTVKLLYPQKWVSNGFYHEHC